MAGKRAWCFLLLAAAVVLALGLGSCKKEDSPEGPEEVPHNVWITINHGARATADTILTVSIQGENIDRMQISATADMSGAMWEPYDTLKYFRVPRVDGSFSVFGRFASYTGAATGIIHDDIILDYSAAITHFDVASRDDTLRSGDEVAFMLDAGEDGEAWISLGSMMSGYFLNPTSNGTFYGEYQLPLFGVPNEIAQVIAHFSDEVGNAARPVVYGRRFILRGLSLQPRLVRHIYIGNSSNERIFIFKDICYLSSEDAVYRMKTDEAASPQPCGMLELPGWNHGIAALDTVLAVANNVSGVVFYLVKPGASPDRIGGARVESYAKDVLFCGKDIYVASYSRGLHVFNIEAGGFIHCIARLEITPFGEAICSQDSLLYIAGGGGLSIINRNLDEPDKPELMSEVTDLDDEPIGILYHRGSIFLTTDELGVIRIDVTDPYHPRVRNFYPHLFNGRRMLVVHPYLVVSRERSVSVVNLSDLGSLPVVAEFGGFTEAQGMCVNGRMLYVAASSEMVVIDLTGTEH